MTSDKSAHNADALDHVESQREAGFKERPPLTLGDLDGLSVSALDNVSKRQLTGLRAREIHTMWDLLSYYPRRYIDRTNKRGISELEPGTEAMVVAVIDKIDLRRIRGGKTMVTGSISDSSGSMKISFFNQPWRTKQLSIGTEAIFFGKVDMYRSAMQFTNPVVDLVGKRTGKIVGIYPQGDKAGISTWELADCISQALRRSAARTIAEVLPSWILDEFNMIHRHEAYVGIHEPTSMGHSQAARKRLAFDELLRMQMSLIRKKIDVRTRQRAIQHPRESALRDGYLAALPFGLTGAQQRVVDEIALDMASPHSMHRLLQGDVGSGKTVVAVATLLTSVSSGRQGAFMAPTEVLAEQHGRSLKAALHNVEVGDSTSLFPARPLRVEVLTAKLSAAERKKLLIAIRVGEVDVVVGTHALIQDGVEFAELGAVVIDEQHRFGVEQRAKLTDSDTGATPDVLVMTATPIPRTAAMTVYGDLDVSVLNEMPQGRMPIDTQWLQTEFTDDAIWDTVRSQLHAGFQAYVVCPLIDPSAEIDAPSASEVFDVLQGAFPQARVALMHGKMRSDEKEETMDAFRDGAVDVLVSTTVIEVGVDVPNANIMVIVGAERFGIAQLHQLRGRVGRGTTQSIAILVSSAATEDGETRLQALCESTNGFELAEIDLEIRGEGTIMGEKQTGRNDLKLASLRRDKDLVAGARSVALRLFESAETDDVVLRQLTNLLTEVDVCLKERDEAFLSKN